jgi:hypothetical protein
MCVTRERAGLMDVQAEGASRLARYTRRELEEPREQSEPEIQMSVGDERAERRDVRSARASRTA